MSKKKKSWRVCPKCKGRATKIVNISVSDKPPIMCQQCGHHYDFPEATPSPEEAELKCVNGHDRCYLGPDEDCPYCERKQP